MYPFPPTLSLKFPHKTGHQPLSYKIPMLTYCVKVHVSKCTVCTVFDSWIYVLRSVDVRMAGVRVTHNIKI